MSQIRKYVARIVVLDIETKEPLVVYANAKLAAYYYGVKTHHIHNAAALREEINDALFMYAAEWEAENKPYYLPGCAKSRLKLY